MALTLYWHPQCQTCRKVKKWLDDHQVAYKELHIVKNPPTRDELQNMYQKSGLEIKRFFSTSTKKYRELGLKDFIKNAPENELLDLLASDGMLIKKPILTNGQKVIIGFNEDELEKISS
jgi:arsenate reductase (glutaredoxin)